MRAEVGGAILQVLPEEGQAVAAGHAARAHRRHRRCRTPSPRRSRRCGRPSRRCEWAQKEATRIENLVKGGALAERDSRWRATPATAGQGAGRRRAVAADVGARSSSTTLTVRAPIAGIVSKRHVNAGDVVSPGTELYTIIDPSSMRLEASVPSEQLAAAAHRRAGRLPGARLSEQTLRGPHRAGQPGGRSVDAAGADLRDDPEQAAAGWSPACSPRAGSSSEAHRRRWSCR